MAWLGLTGGDPISFYRDQNLPVVKICKLGNDIAFVRRGNLVESTIWKVLRQRLSMTVSVLAVVGVSLAACGSSTSNAGATTTSLSGQSGTVFPKHTVTLLVGYSAGSATDLLARSLAQSLNASDHWNVVVEDQPGASGALALSSLEAAKPDGYTLLVATGSLPYVLGAPQSSEKMPLPRTIALVGAQPVALATKASSSFTDLRSLIAAARAKPDSITVGVPGIDDINTDAIYTFAKDAGISFRWVPFKGGSALTAALLGGQVDLATAGPSNFAPSVKAGKIRVLAVSGEAGSAVLPGVSTFSQLGNKVPQVNFYSIEAPAAVPVAIVDEIGKQMKRAVNDSIYRSYLVRSGVGADYLGPSAAQNFVEAAVSSAKQDIPHLNGLFTG